MVLSRAYAALAAAASAGSLPTGSQDSYRTNDREKYCSTRPGIFLADTYPLDIDFVVELPDGLREIFRAWAVSRRVDPSGVGQDW